MNTTARNCLSLPAWFPADKAAAVLRQQNKQFALLADHQGVTQVAALDQLALAPATKSVLWCGRPLGPAVSPTMPAHEARRLMDGHAGKYLPVVLGGVVLGILTPGALSVNDNQNDNAAVVVSLNVSIETRLAA